MRVPQIQVVARPTDDAGIPLLTERLPGQSGGAQTSAAPTTSRALPPLEFDVTLPSTVRVRPLEGHTLAQERRAGFSPAPSSFPLPEFLKAPLSVTPQNEQNVAQARMEGNNLEGDSLARVEEQLREAVFKAVSKGMPENIESLVRQQVSLAIGATLRDVVEPLVARLTTEAQAVVEASVRKSVDNAIAAELARLRSGLG